MYPESVFVYISNFSVLGLRSRRRGQQREGTQNNSFFVKEDGEVSPRPPLAAVVFIPRPTSSVLIGSPYMPVPYPQVYPPSLGVSEGAHAHGAGTPGRRCERSCGET